MIHHESLTDIGGRAYMEDVLQVVDGDDQRWCSICVADGHGGASVAHRTIQLLPKACVRALSGEDVDTDDHVAVSKVLWKAFNDVDQVILSESQTHVGATFCGLFYDRRTSKLIAANCGDTMAAVFFSGGRGGDLRSELVSAEHKASSEVAALQARGATVVDVYGMMRVQGTLNLSRAMGDGYLKKYIICSPAVTVVRLDRLRSADEASPICAIVASDGVWDVLDKDDLAVILKNHRVLDPAVGRDNLKAAAETIHQLSRLKGSTDNVALVIALL